jgi:hypothetical protein
VFVTGSAFPVTAGLAKDTAFFPTWWGALDVGIAFVLVVLAIVLIALTQGKVSEQAEDAGYGAYRVLTHGILGMIVVFLLFGDRITWINCLPGFAWRAWLLLYSLPAWFTAFESRRVSAGPPRSKAVESWKAGGFRSDPGPGGRGVRDTIKSWTEPACCYSGYGTIGLARSTA